MHDALQSLVARYGGAVDKDLIAAIWAEHGEDRCRDIVRMLGDADSRDGSTTADAETASATCSEPLSSRSATSASTSVSTGARRALLPADDAVEPIASPQVLVEFLVACFPECGRDYLATKVQEMFCSRGQDAFLVDPVEAIAIVSSAFDNDVETVEAQQFQQRRRAQPPGKSCGASLAAIQAQYTVPRAKPKPRSRTKPKSSGRGSAPAARAAQRAPSNAWSAIGAELDILCAAFPALAVATVRSTYHACGANPNRAAARLSELGAASEQPQRPHGAATAAITGPTSRSSAETSRMVETLRALFPGCPSAQLERAVAESLDIDAAAERLLGIVEEPAPAPAPAPASAPKGRSAKSKWRPANSLACHHVQPAASARGDDDNGGEEPPERASLDDISGAAREWVGAHPTDPAVCRRRAAAEMERRNELYTKAAHAYVRRNQLNHSSGTAAFYSAEARKHDERARIWRMRAAHASVAAMRHWNAGVVDLHGLTSMEAVAVVKSAVAAWHADATAGGSAAARPLHIVTGLGNHSADGRARIHPWVLNVLRAGGWHFVEGDGYIDLLGRSGSRQH